MPVARGSEQIVTECICGKNWSHKCAGVRGLPRPPEAGSVFRKPKKTKLVHFLNQLGNTNGNHTLNQDELNHAVVEHRAVHHSVLQFLTLLTVLSARNSGIILLHCHDKDFLLPEYGPHKCPPNSVIQEQ